MYTSNTDTPYTVIHQQEELDGTYKTVETENLKGTTDTKVKPAVKTYEGFTAGTVTQEEILGDGSTVVKVPITVKNLSSETHSLNMFYYSIFGSKGRELDSVSSYFDDSVDFAGELRNGASYTKYLYFLYDGNGTYAIEFDNFSTKVIVEFNI